MRPLPLSDYVYYFSSPTNTSLFTTSFFNSINNSPPLLSPPLLLNPTLFPTDFNNKNHQPISPPPVNILHPIISSHRPPPPLLPTTTLPSSGTHLHFPHTLIYTHNIPIPTYIRKYSSSIWSGYTTTTSWFLESKYPATSPQHPQRHPTH